MILTNSRLVNMARITSFNISWYAGYFACTSGAIEHDIVTVYRSSHKLKHKVAQFPEVGEDFFGEFTPVLEESTLIISKELAEAMFTLLEQADSKDLVELSYEKDIIEASAWELRIRYSDRTVRRATGNITYPSYGEELENLIRAAISEAGSEIQPMCFLGCACKPSFNTKSES